jgi:molybdopterin/thiamine biosynthesis adenylyltransferase
MTTAAEKNEQALMSLFGNAELASRISSTRIAIVIPTTPLLPSGKLVATVLSDTLGRLWPNIDFHGCGVEEFINVAVDAAESGGSPTNGLRVNWAPPYDCVISIGERLPSDVGHAIQVGANDWEVQLGPDAYIGESQNPVGPAFAAALAAAQLFLFVFASELRETNAILIESCQINLLKIFGLENVSVTSLDLEETHIFGAGAVSHGLLWLLQNWPEDVNGSANLVDQDNYGESNGQRYAFMHLSNQHKSKVQVLRERLTKAHPNLSVFHHPMDLNSYCDKRGYDFALHRIIAGLDSAEARRHTALKLPESAINMWTEGVRIGAGRYRPGTDGACLACGYLEKVSSPIDEVAEIFTQTGIRPDLIRDLLDSGRGMSSEEAGMLAGYRSLPSEQFIDEPLRSVLPALCATGKIQLPGNSEAVDVPFAFASLFAGIAGFMMLLKDCSDKSSSSYEWTQNIFKQPSLFMHRRQNSNPNCICCRMMQGIDVSKLINY